MPKTLLLLISKSVSFCKHILGNKKNFLERRLISRKIRMQFVMRYITECILYSDNYLITCHQARAIAKMFYFSKNENIMSMLFAKGYLK